MLMPSWGNLHWEEEICSTKFLFFLLRCGMCIAGWEASSLRRGREQERFVRKEFLSPKRMEGPHIFRKWYLSVGIHRVFLFLSTPAASCLYNPRAQTGSISQCFPRGFWWDTNLLNIMVKGLDPNSHHRVIPTGNRCSWVVFIVTKENKCTIEMVEMRINFWSFGS